MSQRGNIGDRGSYRKFLQVIVILGAVFYLGCDEDEDKNNGGSKGKCPENQFWMYDETDTTGACYLCINGNIDNYGDCACPVDPVSGERYYDRIDYYVNDDEGNPVLAGLECVCSAGMGYYDDGHGGCTKDSGSTCGENKVESEDGCVCDSARGYIDDGMGGCTKDSEFSCGENEIKGENGCFCDEKAGYVGNENACYKCDDFLKNSIIQNGVCMCRENEDARWEAVGDGDDSAFVNTCGCAAASGYYGESGSCQLCSGEGRIIDDAGQCVCDTKNGYESNGSGGCRPKPCGDRKKLSGDECVCDEDAGYFDASGACVSCQEFLAASYPKNMYLEYAVRKDGECVCDSSKHLKFGKISSGLTHSQVQSYGCVCDIADGWYGETGSCQKCPAEEHKVAIYLAGVSTCDCDQANGWYDNGHGVCEHLKECTPNKTRCENSSKIKTCDSQGFWGTAVACPANKECGRDWDGTAGCICQENDKWTHNDAGECVCRSANHWKSDGNGGCVCNYDEGYQYSEEQGKCVCSRPDYISENGVCKKCRYTITGNECINYRNNVITFGSYPQSSDRSAANPSKEPLKWRVVQFDTNANSTLLLSEYIIDVQPYYKSLESSQSKWIPSDVRKWLNNEFKNTAFTSDERAYIDQARHFSGSNTNTPVSEKYPFSYVNSEDEGDDTDNIGLIPMSTLLNYSFLNRKATATNYAKSSGGSWGTRTPIYTNHGYWDQMHTHELDFFVVLDKEGEFAYDTPDGSKALYYHKSYNPIGIRPAIWVKCK